jgi:hypothetical protein
MDAETERLIRYLVTNVECVGCHRSYDFEDIRVVEKRPTVYVLLMTCQNCGTKGLLMAFLQERAEDPEGSEQVETRSGHRPITADDVLDVHRLLERFDGDCSALLKDSSDPGSGGEGADGRTGRLAARGA